MENDTIISLKERIEDICWTFGNLLMDRDEIDADLESIFGILKDGHYEFANYFDVDEWDDEVFNCYIELWELCDQLYDEVDVEGQDEEQTDEFIRTALLNYVVWI